jgi:hypothetical protein
MSCGFVFRACMGEAERVRIGIDFVDRLGPGESLTGTPTVSVTPSGPTVTDPSAAGTVVQALVGGGPPGNYRVTFLADTTSGQVLGGWVALVVGSDPSHEITTVTDAFGFPLVTTNAPHGLDTATTNSITLSGTTGYDGDWDTLAGAGTPTTLILIGAFTEAATGGRWDLT